MTKHSLFKLFTGALLLVSFSTVGFGQKVRLRSQIAPSCTQVRATTGWKFADLFGDGNIAVQGSYGCNGAFIYDITNPDAPVLASWYNPGNNQQFLEAIVVGNRGYFGSGIGNGGVHIVDLTNPSIPVLLGTVDSTHAAGYNTIHEMMVVSQGGATYLIENSNSTGNLPVKIIDITNPAAPVAKSQFSATDSSWIHAMHIRGNRMYTSGFLGTKVDIFDISNLASTSAPPLLGSVNIGSTTSHSSWTSEDGRYLYTCRETFDGDLRVYDVQNAASPVLIRSIRAGDLGINAVTPHNPVVMGNYLYVSWYQAGIQVFELTDPAFPKRVAQYDTFPSTFAPTEQQIEALKTAEPWDMICGMPGFQSSALPSNYDGNWAVYPFLGQNKVLAGDLTNGLLILDASAIAAPLKNRVSDFDGDGKTDISVFKPTNGNWNIEQSSNGSPTTVSFGLNGDVITPGDYDGDGITDLAVFRPSTGTWWIRRSTNQGNFLAVQFGSSGDIPVAADYDADGRTDVAVWRPSTGVWYISQSTLGLKILQWGLSTDKPVIGDFEGDGKIDVAVWRPSTGIWYVLQSSSSIPLFGYWGTNGDKPVSGDFDGNGVSDFAVYRPSTGTWYVLDPSTLIFRAFVWGIAEDMPIPADYDGDAKADVAIFRPSTNEWYCLSSSNSSYIYRVFGQAGDRPSPSSVQPQ